MKTLREMAEEMRRSADVIEQKAIANQSNHLHEVARGNRRIADALDAGHKASERLAIARDLLIGLTSKVLRPDLSTDQDATRRLQWASKNVKAFIDGDPIEPLEDGEA